jgi:hypothetical protein
MMEMTLVADADPEDALVLTTDATAALIERGRGGGGEWGRDDADGRRRQQL